MATTRPIFTFRDITQPLMGSPLWAIQAQSPQNQSGFNDISNNFSAVYRAGYAAMSASGSTFGGFRRPLVGYFGGGPNFAETTSAGLDLDIEIPSGVTNYAICLHVRTISEGTTIEAVTATLRKQIAVGSVVQSLTGVISAATTGTTGNIDLFFTGVLSPLMRANGNFVELATLELVASKSNPRASVNKSVGYWDGIWSVSVKFFL